MPRRRPRSRRFEGHRGRLFAAIAIGVLVVLALSMKAIATFWTDFLWFDDLGLGDIWRRLLSARATLAIVATVVFFLIAWVNLLVAERISSSAPMLNVDDEVLERYQRAVAGRQRLVLALVSLGVALVPGIGAAGEWQNWLLFRFGGSFGTNDPQFGTDIGFYVFKLPFLSQVVDWLFGFLLVTLLLSVALYYLNGAIRLQSNGERITAPAKAHLSVVLALLALVKAADYWLQRFELTFRAGDKFDGAGYTAVKAVLPALQLLMLVALFAAALFIVNIRRRGWILPAIAIALWMVTSVVVAGIYPAFVQRFQVDPAQLNKETPYIERNIEATRVAMGIDDIESSELEYEPELTPEAVEQQRANIDYARLLDPSQVRDTINSLQFGRQYYTFRDVDVDRYRIGDDANADSGGSADSGGTATPTIISARELDLSGVDSTWEKQHLVFTHGYAAALAPANTTNSRGEPDFLVRNIPVQVTGLPDLDKPEIYVGEDMEGYAIVGTEQDELSSDNLTTEYDGSTGVAIDSLLRKAAFSLRFGEIDPMISDLLTEDSRVIYRRDILERVDAIAPYLLLDPDPYPVLLDGRMVYVVDGYTSATTYPYGESFQLGGSSLDVNYLRNSVKVAVDAYDGTVQMYLADTLYGSEDPIARAWAKAFPDLYEEEIPADLLAHLRYPELLFKQQTEAWGRYHQESPRTFFNNSDLWDIAQAPPTSSTATAVATSGLSAAAGAQRFEPIDPYFQTIQMTPDSEPEFVLTRPYVLASDDDSARNLTAVLVAHNDPGSYGKLAEVVVEGGGDTVQVDGPLRASEKISTYPPVSQYQTVVGQRGSSVIFGNMLILPFGDSILYVRPVYARQENQGLNTLQRVAVASGDGVGFGETLDDALDDLFDQLGSPEPDVDATEPEPTEELDDGSSPEVPPSGGTPEELLAEADRLFDEADAALAASDLGRYADLVEQARALVAEAAAALGTGSSGTASTSTTTTTLAGET